MTRRSLFSRGIAVALLGLTALAAASCGEVARTGRSPAFLIIEALEGDSGADDEENFSNVLMSDVQTIVEQSIGTQTVRIATTFNDSGRVRFRLALKNPGTATSPLGPSTLNEITVTRYRVVYRRTDGRNTAGVDVPHPFEGGMTITVPAQATVEGVFDIVRHTSKSEPPLRNLIGGGQSGQINTIAEVTFFGRDQAGNEVTASGLVTVNFADFGDPR
jgi:hypothetical protein